MNNKKTILTRFIGNRKYLDKKDNPTPSIFIKKNNESGLSMWDVTDYIKKKDDIGIFKLGDENYAKNPPYTIARCDFFKTSIVTIFEKIAKKTSSINYSIISSGKPLHKEIVFNDSGNPALSYTIAQELYNNIYQYKKRPKGMDRKR